MAKFRAGDIFAPNVTHDGDDQPRWRITEVTDKHYFYSLVVGDPIRYRAISSVPHNIIDNYYRLISINYSKVWRLLK